MLMVLFGLIFQNQGNVNYTIHVQDQDNTPLSHNFTDMLGKIKASRSSAWTPISAQSST